MRHDISKLICERQRRCSSEKSQKTRKKLNTALDYDSYDYDWGPTRVSSARRRQEGRCSGLTDNGGKHITGKSLNENLSPLYRFLDKSVGRPWDKVFAEIKANIDSRQVIGYHVLQHVGWHVCSEPHGLHRYSYRLYVDENGILRKRKRQRYRRPKAPVTTLHWHGNVYFEKRALRMPAACGCVCFKYREVNSDNTPRWRRYNPGPPTCIHGNTEPTRDQWYVVEYGHHAPDAVYQTFRYETCSEWDRTRYGLKVPGDTHVIYYRDKPEILNKPFVIREKVVNRKEKALVDAALDKQ